MKSNPKLLFHFTGGIGNQLFQISRLELGIPTRVVICKHRSASTETIEQFGVDLKFLEQNQIKIIENCSFLDRRLDWLLVGIGNRFKQSRWRSNLCQVLSTNLGDDSGPLGRRAWGFFQNRRPFPSEIQFAKKFAGLTDPPPHRPNCNSLSRWRLYRQCIWGPFTKILRECHFGDC
jgi:hypothetical protein